MNRTNEVFHQEDFSHQDLSESSFKKCQFIRCNFHHTDLRDAQFVDCSFIEREAIEGCDFRQSDLRDASFKGCQLSMSNFTGAHCFGIEFRHCDLKGTCFIRAVFSHRVSHKISFCSAFITGCNLSYANFERQCIEKCDLFENRWIGANLQNASLRESDLSRGVFSADCWEQFQMQGCNLCHAELTGLNPLKVDLSGVKICDWQQEQLLDQLGIIVVPG